MPDNARLSQLLSAVDDAHDEIVALCQDLVRIPSINFGTKDSGDELPAAELLRDKLAADGIDGTVFKPAENRGNIVADLGGGDGPRLLYMSHIDVVPVEDEAQWKYPPFGAEIHDNRIWGRGANDMKDTVAAQAMALCLLKRAGFEPKGTLSFASCADEEAGGAFGFGWQAKNHPETLRADYAVNEGGGTPVLVDGKTIYSISTGEKGRLEIHFRVTGRGYHASQPWMADNAIYKAEELVRRFREYSPTISVEADVFRHLETLAGISATPTAENIDRLLAQIAERNPSLASRLRAASRMTLVATMVRAGVKSNSVAENCTIVCDVRSLPSQDVNYVREQATRIANGLDGVSFEVVETAISNSSPFDSPFRAHVEAATRAATGIEQLTFIPDITVGFTDSRFVRPLGNVTYGYIPSHPDDDPSLGGQHNINESTGIKSLITATKFHVALALEVLG
jgi:acetylornithine deacetylase/succinyl-diaminopimelate desuccinylase-like protein